MGVKAEHNRRHNNNECLCVECKVTSSRTTHKVSRGKGGKSSVARATARPPSSINSQQAVPIRTPRNKTTDMVPTSAPIEVVGSRSPKEWWLRSPNLLHVKQLGRRMPTTYTFASRAKLWRQRTTDLPIQWRTPYCNGLGHIIQRQLFIQFL